MFLETRLSLASRIATVTGISQYRISPALPVETANIATQLSWAAKRRTSRLEDTAYCLLGVFGINMPLLYGEGGKAFRRLQMELASSTKDESLFVWDIPDIHLDHSVGVRIGLLASAMWQYKLNHATNTREFSQIAGISRPRYSITKQGLELIVPEGLAAKRRFLLPLNCCHYEGEVLKGVYAICIEPTGWTWERVISNDYIDDLPALSDTVYCSHTYGLFIVPVDWVWSRENLAQRGSRVIYADIGVMQTRWYPNWFAKHDWSSPKITMSSLERTMR